MSNYKAYALLTGLSSSSASISFLNLGDIKIMSLVTFEGLGMVHKNLIVELSRYVNIMFFISMPFFYLHL